MHIETRRNGTPQTFLRLVDLNRWTAAFSVRPKDSTQRKTIDRPLSWCLVASSSHVTLIPGGGVGHPKARQSAGRQRVCSQTRLVVLDVFDAIF